MQWDRTGKRICIVYEDGAVILGSVDGNRIWGKEVKNTNLAHVQWSPDGNFLLFGTSRGQLQLFDSQGNFASKITDHWHQGSDFKITAIDWYNGAGGFIQANVPCLAICFDDGRIQIMRNQRDEYPVRFEVQMTKIKMAWNIDGSILAVGGMQILTAKDGEERETCVIQFWSPFGQFLRSIRIPGKNLSSLSWEDDGLRIAIAVDSFVYFANVRPDYRWAYFAQDVLVYAFTSPDSVKSSLMFWNTSSNEKSSKVVEQLLSITAAGDYCVVATKTTDGSEQSVLTLYNAIGVPVDVKYLDFEPKHVVVSRTNVFCANDRVVFHWQFKQLASVKMSALDALRRKDIRDRAFHIDDMTTIGSGEVSTLTPELLAQEYAYRGNRRLVGSPISCLAASDSCLLIARQDGQIFQYLVPSLSLDFKYALDILPIQMSMNCNSTRASLLDKNGVFKLLELENAKPTAQGKGMVTAAPSLDNIKYTPGKLLDMERKDVWGVRWARDNPEMFAIMEKTRLLIFRTLEAEDPVASSSYLCDFDNLEVKTVLLDEVFKNCENPLQTFMGSADSKPLREVKELITTNLAQAASFALEFKHVRLWKEISQAALEQLNLEIATSAFVQCQDFQGLQFVKRLKKLDDPSKKQAEIAAFLQKFDQAEKMYIDMDRKDLAIELRTRLGDWFRVVQLLKNGGAGDDVLLEKAWNHIGDYYYDRQRWAQAITYYTQGRNVEKLIELHYMMEDYEGLEKLSMGLSENSPHLRNIADKFLAAGMCLPAFNAYMKWSTAISLAETHHYKEIEEFLEKYSRHILSQNRKKEAVELYRKANYCQKSARLLFELAHDAIKEGQSPNTIKKLFVLGALEVERHLTIQKSNKSNPNAALEHLLQADSASPDAAISLEKPWRGAEAYHFYLLAQKQFYSGELDAAVVTASHLRDYEDVMKDTTIYSLLALVSLHAGYYGTCSNAFLKLESIGDKHHEYYRDLAFEIFTKHKPKDPEGELLVCSNCLCSMKEK
ncbi:WD repeat-containing protein 35 [Kappamyces sp. JEL0680]|nr:WD repeat-containing protein 35 [Kappamyces sp. JEL0680]